MAPKDENFGTPCVSGIKINSEWLWEKPYEFNTDGRVSRKPKNLLEAVQRTVGDAIPISRP